MGQGVRRTRQVWWTESPRFLPTKCHFHRTGGNHSKGGGTLGRAAYNHHRPLDARRRNATSQQTLHAVLPLALASYLPQDPLPHLRKTRGEAAAIQAELAAIAAEAKADEIAAELAVIAAALALTQKQAHDWLLEKAKFALEKCREEDTDSEEDDN